MPYTWVNGDVITSTRLNAIEQDRAPVTVQSITGQPNNVIANYPVNAFRMATAAIGDYAYLFGGMDGTASNGALISTAYRYQFSTNTYTSIASLATANFYVAAAVGSNIYLMPQTATHTMIRYNVSANTYTNLATYGTTATNLQMIAIGTNIYITQGNALYRYDTVGNTYTTLAVPPATTSFMGSDGVDLYLFGSTNSYKYSVAGNTYTGIASDSSVTTGSFAMWPIVGYLYIGPAGSTLNKNSIHFQFTIAGNSFIGAGQIKYNITANSYSSGGEFPNPFTRNRCTFCAVPGQERVIMFSSNQTSIAPFAMMSAIAFTPAMSPFTASSNGIAVTYGTGNNLRNITTTANGTTVAFKTGEVIANNASYLPVWGGSAVAAFDAIVIQKG